VIRENAEWPSFQDKPEVSNGGENRQQFSIEG
jgi:hypothetical protein